MDVAVRAAPTEREFIIRGDFTAHDEDRFFDVFLQIRAMQEPQAVFNLAGCVFMDSAAMGMLVVAAQEAAKFNKIRVIRAAPPQIMALLQSAGFEKFYHFQ